MELLSPYFPDYELIDSGLGEKLERFGNLVVARPEPQALWDKSLPPDEWNRQAHAYFVKGKTTKRGQHPDNQADEWGEWRFKPGVPNSWTINYRYKSMNLRMLLRFSSFKHVGVFPEQAANWDYVFDSIQSGGACESKILNLFAYTGGMSLAARAAGAAVTHVDSVRNVVNCAHQNMQLSQLADIRWIVDDVTKFVSREIRRNARYTGIILDPPAYGRGPDGEKWLLAEHLLPLLQQCKLLLQPKNSFVVLNLYSMGFSPLIAENLLLTVAKPGAVSSGELFVSDRAERKLPLGVYARAVI